MHSAFQSSPSSLQSLNPPTGRHSPPPSPLRQAPPDLQLFVPGRQRHLATQVCHSPPDHLFLERMPINVSNKAARGGASRVSAISVMFEGVKHRESSALTDDCARIPDVLKGLRVKHERRKCGMESNSKAASK